MKVNNQMYKNNPKEFVIEKQEHADVSIPAFKVIQYNPPIHKYCLIIPVFNEGDRFKEQLSRMNSLFLHELVDIIICDAGSNDGSNDGSTNPDFLSAMNVSFLLTRIGIGRYSTDIKMGYDFALKRGYKGIITVDGNNKDGVESVSAFCQRLNEGYDYIQGSRFIRGGVEKNTPLIRKLALKFINEPIMSFISRRKLTDTTNGFRAYSANFLTHHDIKPFRKIFFGYELIYYLPYRASTLGFKCIEIPVSRKYPDTGEVPSKVGGIKGNIYQLSILANMLLKKYNPK